MNLRSISGMTCCLLALLATLSITAHAAVQFNTRQDINTGFRQLAGTVVADFNGDGKADIAATDLYDKRVMVYLNDGKGGFGTPSSTMLPISNTTGTLVAGDVNEDGVQDVIVSRVSGAEEAYVLLGKGDGNFTVKGLIPNSYGFDAAATVDVNGDKHLDLICGGNGSVFLLIDDGKGKFTSKSIPNQGNGGLYLSLIAGGLQP